MGVLVNEIMELYKLFLKKYQEKNICKCKCVQATITENISLWEGVWSLKPNTYEQATITENKLRKKNFHMGGACPKSATDKVKKRILVAH